jgi:hypothetical protein
MDEASGCCGLIVVILAIVLLVASFRAIQQEPAPIEGPAQVAGRADRDRFDLFDWWPLSPRTTMIAIALLYGGGLYYIRPHARYAKSRGSSPQQAAIYALSLYALSPIIVPAKAVWFALGAIGQALTSSPDDDGKPGPSKPGKPRGLDDL